MPDEKEKLLDLFDQKSKWCQHVEAQDASGDPAQCMDEGATAWDLTGGIYRLFGWQRATILYAQLDRHVRGKRNSIGLPSRNLELDSMVALQQFNDDADTTFDVVRSRLETMPVWSGHNRTDGSGT